MLISFVYYFHSMRTENLKQTLRFLFKRESSIGEVILVCNDTTKERFEGCTLFNLGLGSYEKPKMCNFGVSKASHDVVALLDSDRILPTGYFKNILERIRPGLMFSCERLLGLDRQYTDEEIESGNFSWQLEMKSRTCEIRMKNLFSGNTTFMKDDYIRSGGMDEQFVGYGFADNDMTLNVLSKGMEAVWEEGYELHLHHEKQTMEDNKIVNLEQFKKTSQKNLVQYLKKWGMTDNENYPKKTFL